MDEFSFHKPKVFLRGRGGSDAGHKADEVLYHTMLERHEELERVTTKWENGFEAVTRVTSGDAELVAMLQEHVIGMKKRFDGGRAIRSWDPLFVELFDCREAINIAWEMLEDGVKVVMTSDNPEVRELLMRHDETLQAFVNYGFQASRHESPYRP